MTVSLAVALAATLSARAWADPPNVAEVESLVQKLDSAEYFERESAMRRLQSLAGDPVAAGSIAAHVRQLAIRQQLSFEAQMRLAEVLRDLPKGSPPHSEPFSQDQIAKLIDELGDDRFTVREHAARRLRWSLATESNIIPLLLALKEQLANPKVPASTFSEYTLHYHEVRGAWLSTNHLLPGLPAVDDDRIREWVKILAEPIEDEDVFRQQSHARRELEDVLVRDECRERAANILKEALATVEDPMAIARLQELVDLTRPAMVAEIWSSARVLTWIGGAVISDGDPLAVHHVTTQYLHIGVPQKPEGADRFTHFDRCDDSTAHCVSGNSLLPGDYPVGTAVPHPDGHMTMFHLVNLPTPRRRLIYEYQSQRREAVRLRELSERTCQAFLDKKREFTELDTSVLMMLDRSVIAQFAGKFFEQVKDAPLDGHGNRLLVGRTSIHGAVCYALAFTGTKEAAPAVLKAIENERILPPEANGHYDLPSIALLAIASRDPWRDCEAWLLAQLEREQPLISNADPAPQLAATAAAILADRWGESQESLGLIPVGDDLFQQIGLPPYRFDNDDAREKARQRLQRRQAERDRLKAS